MKITVYQNHESNDDIRPVWLAIDFLPDSVPWTEPSLYVDVTTYETNDLNNFMDDVIGCSIYLEELLGNPGGNKLGFDLKSIYERINSTGFDPYLIERFIVQVSDAAEIISIGEGFI